MAPPRRHPPRRRSQLFLLTWVRRAKPIAKRASKLLHSWPHGVVQVQQVSERFCNEFQSFWVWLPAEGQPADRNNRTRTTEKGTPSSPHTFPTDTSSNRRAPPLSIPIACKTARNSCFADTFLVRTTDVPKTLAARATDQFRIVVLLQSCLCDEVGDPLHTIARLQCVYVSPEQASLVHRTDHFHQADALTPPSENHSQPFLCVACV